MASTRTVIDYVRLACIVCLLAVIGALPASSAPGIFNVTQSSTTVGLYDKHETTLNVGTVATNPYWPYDETPNAGVPAKVGVSVDGLFTNDNWQTTIVQPGFYFQDYERGNYLLSGYRRDWLYPKGNPCWKIRFAPTKIGTWQYKIRVTDASGTTTSSQVFSFNCVASSNRGFVRVSPTDSRYFETSDGKYLNLIGLADNTTNTYAMDTLYTKYNENGINLIRPWWQGSQGPVVFGLSGQGGTPYWSNLSVSSEVTRPGEMYSGKITTNTTVSTFVDVKPSKKYRYSVWAKTVGLQGSGDYGVYLQVFDCTTPDTPLTSKIRSTDWTEIVGSFTSKSGQYAVDFLKIVTSGITAGSVYFTDVSVREDLGNGQYGAEQMVKPNFNAYQYVSQYEAWKADYQVECAKRNDVYLKVCLEEKADIIYSGIQPNGTAGATNDENIYASATHASRTYQSYFWRYMIARYGYATSIHSWEFCNEGDPFNANHYDATEALAKYVKGNDPNKHLAVTSFWHSYPTKEFWSQAAYQDVGYLDWHQYVGLQTGSIGLQYLYGWQRNSAGGGGIGVYPFTLDSSVYRSAPSSFYINNPTGYDARGESYAFAISPGHKYTLSWYIKGRNLTATGSQAGSTSWVFPTIAVLFKDGWWSSEISSSSPGAAGESLGTYDWTHKTYSVTAPANAHYMILFPSAHWAVGECWYDDITLYDETAGEYLEVPNGNFDSSRLDYDTALLTYSIGTQTGTGSSRVVSKPMIRGEVGISGDKVYGDTYKTIGYTGENQQLVDDTNGIWFKKLTWGQINPFGVIDMYWWRDNIETKGLHRYAAAYQAFMADIPLSNGNYRNALATTSTPVLRAWGQKDLVSNTAHLWIDNSRYTWKNVVDGVAVPAITGSVIVSGLKDGVYKAEWWDTTSGTVTRTDNVTCSGGSVTLQVQNLQSDTAVKILPTVSTTPAVINLKVITPSTAVKPGEVVTITVEFSNTGGSSASSVLVSAAVPAEMDYVAGSAEASGGTWNSATRKVSWTVGSLATGATGTRVFQAKVK